jgi:hypothetical protein
VTVTGIVAVVPFPSLTLIVQYVFGLTAEYAMFVVCIGETVLFHCGPLPDVPSIDR